jgi:hypothetical protein
MGINYADGLCDDSGYRIRCMDSLIKQVETDYDDLKSSLKMLKNNAIDISKIDEVLGKISWIKKGLKMLEGLKVMKIESVLSNEIVEIEKKIMDIEMDFKILRLSRLKRNDK